MRIQVLVRLKTGVLDVQGKAVENALHGLNFKEVSGVRMGKLIELDVEEESFEKAKDKVEMMCKTLLVNPIIENYEIRSK